jgi:hypothetical protein
LAGYDGHFLWLCRRGRHIVLLGDDAPTHTVGGTEVGEEHGFKVINLSNFKLIFLPANTTTVVQPLDQGITASMKAHYRRHFVRWLLSEAGKAGNKEKGWATYAQASIK